LAMSSPMLNCQVYTVFGYLNSAITPFLYNSIEGDISTSSGKKQITVLLKLAGLPMEI
jgi:hypothetical protein